MDFVDSNVFICAYDRGDDRQGRALELLEELSRTRNGAVSVQVLQEFFVNAVAKVTPPVPMDVARERVRSLARWPVFSPVADDVVRATVIAESNRISFWDAMVVHSAASLGCRVLWTEDLNHGQVIEGVEVRNPFVEDGS